MRGECDGREKSEAWLDGEELDHQRQRLLKTQMRWEKPMEIERADVVCA